MLGTFHVKLRSNRAPVREFIAAQQSLRAGVRLDFVGGLLIPVSAALVRVAAESVHP